MVSEAPDANVCRTQQYVSPSDSIQSPATQKLSAFRNKHITKKYVDARVDIDMQGGR